MRKLAGVLVLVTAALGTVACDDDSPSDGGTSPVISALQVLGAQRVSGDTGLVFLGFDYTDPDRDIDRVLFRVAGSTANNDLPEAGDLSGRVTVQQAVTLPAAGTAVQFTVYVVDRRGHRSNELAGEFVAP